MRFSILAFLMCSWVSVLLGAGRAQALEHMALQTSWHIQNSENVMAGGMTISLPQFNDTNWTAATVPSTVLANLAGSHLGDGSVDDPFYSDNWMKLPGSGSYYQVGKNYGEVVTPPESPFGHPWWYRTSFNVSAAQLRGFADLHLKGITYGAEVWVNGTRLADVAGTRGSYRQFRYDVTPSLHLGANTIAILVNPPLPTDLSPSWVDWNPTPQDKNMGLWREVFVDFHGPVAVRRAFVATEFPTASLASADLTVQSELTNSTSQTVTGMATAQLLGLKLSQTVNLAPGETRRIYFRPLDYPQLHVSQPQLWWPWQMGAAVLHPLKVAFSVGRQVSDESSVEFGIRKMTSELTPEGARLFSVNGKKIFIRGGGWASDLLLRFNENRQERELNYVRTLGLNTIRLEGRFETEHLLDLADRKGILVMPGWVCCNAWQEGLKWDPSNHEIARASMADQLYELRAHASVFTFLYGSDEIPPADIEGAYLDAIRETDWPNSTLAAASDRISTVGRTGVKMSGPYAYTPPSYWYVDSEQKYGGAWGFNTETSPGVSMPPLASLHQFIPPDHFGKVDELWNFHMGENEFATLDRHREAVDRRYGVSADAVEFVRKSEVMDYDNHRAMFEAYQAHKYHSATGVVQWMLNSAWPSMMWHLYDYYMRPGSAFYGVKKANSMVHASLDPSTLTVSAVNSNYAAVGGLTVSARVIAPDASILSSLSHVISLDADSAVDVMKLTEPVGVPLYFVSLETRDARGVVVDTNFYWLSSKKEIYDWDETDFKNTPVTEEGDFSSLSALPPASVAVSVSGGAPGAAVVTLRNTGKTLAFFIHADLFAGGHEVIPVDWSDNNISLMPGETRVLHARAMSQVSGALSVRGSGWNVRAF